MAFALALGVTPEGLKSKSTDINADIQDMQQRVDRLRDEVAGTSSYWQGEAGKLQRQNFEEQVVELNSMLERLRTYPTRILQMAGIYEQTEEANTTVAAGLSTDIVMM